MWGGEEADLVRLDLHLLYGLLATLALRLAVRLLGEL